jgi:hypothetical protein
MRKGESAETCGRRVPADVRTEETLAVSQTETDCQPAASPAPTDEWVTLAAASRILGRHVGAVKSIGLAGGVRVKAQPGCRILYHAGDRRTAAGASVKGGAVN